MPRGATLRDVADRVGVSPRTVSRVVNDEGGFSEVTRVRVLEAVEDLGYQPNMLARGLITHRSGTVGLVGVDMTDPFFPAMAEGIQNAARETGRTIFFASNDGDSQRQAEVFRSLWSHAVDGVIVFPAPGTIDQLAGYARRGMPLVVVDDIVEFPNLASVSFDLEDGAVQAAQHLLATGRRRIGMIGSEITVPRTRRRERGFYQAFESPPVGAELPELVRVQPTVSGGAAGLQKLLERRPDLDGIFAYNDLMAVGAMRAAQASGYRVPDDIAIVGCNDIEMSALLNPGLTTIRLDRPRLSAEAIRVLHELIEEPTSNPTPLVLPVELVIREST
ncbi:MAG: LacI family transcriptional regulator [Acidimicrobiaceae bacterium]|nr:LacI family transcriptional regulator [Acidimicrobiaceae bacterium]MYG55904.1 LacI family transcriptional regulator [Acidimicrobiaceae bacterium]MYJ99494.1 LacI family transcriptional regulator [Acidimicrobiaceae bacterium]